MTFEMTSVLNSSSPHQFFSRAKRDTKHGKITPALSPHLASQTGKEIDDSSNPTDGQESRQEFHSLYQIPK
jgi:hypothetical protein